MAFSAFSTRGMDDDEELNAAPMRGVGLLGGGDEEGGLRGLLGGVGSKFADNSNLMAALGFALMSGARNNPFENMNTALSTGGTMDARAQKARQEAMEKAAKQKAYREWAIANGKDPNLLGADPELGRTIAAGDMAKPSFQERLYSGLPEGQRAEAANSILGVTKNSGYEPITQKTSDGERTIGYRDKGTGKVLSIAQMNQMSGFNAPAQDDAIPGVDMDELRKKRADALVKEQEAVNQRARQAAGMMPHVDRALDAYKELGTAGIGGTSAIGPLAASKFNRTIEGATGQRPEVLRQEYEAAAKELELAKAQISMKGQGAITQSERQILAMTLPRLDAADSQIGIRTLQNMKGLLTQYESEKAGQSRTGNTGNDEGWNVVAPGVRFREKR